MKRPTYLLVFALAAISLVPVLGQTRLEVISRATPAGAMVSVPILLQSTQAVVAIQFDLVYDSGQLSSDNAIPSPDLAQAFRVRSSEPARGRRRVVVYSQDNRPIPAITFVSIPLTVFEGVPRGVIPLVLTNVFPASIQATVVQPLAIASGSLIIGPTGPVEIGSVVFTTEGTFEIELTGVQGQQVTVEASTDLIRWDMLETFTASTDTFVFTDRAAANFTHRFYRMRSTGN